MTQSFGGHGADAPSDALTPGCFRAGPERWLPRLNRLLDEQCALCGRLDELSDRQSAVVDGGDTDALLGILGERQALIDRVTALNAEMEPFRAGREALMGLLGEDERAGVQRRIERIAELVERVRARDDADRAALERQRAAVAQQLSGVSTSRGAVAAYAAGAYGVARPGPRFQDRNG